MRCRHGPQFSGSSMLLWAVLTISIWQSTFTSHVSPGSSWNLQNGVKVKVKGEYDVMNLNPVSILRRKSRSSLPFGSSILPLNHHIDESLSTRSLYEPAPGKDMDALAWLRSSVRQLLQPDLDQEPPLESSRSSPGSRSKPVLSLVQMMIKKQKHQEIRHALRKKHKQEVRSSGKEPDGDKTAGQGQDTVSGLADLETLNKAITRMEEEKAMKSGMANFPFLANARINDDAIMADADTGFSSLDYTDDVRQSQDSARLINEHLLLSGNGQGELRLIKLNPLKSTRPDWLSGSADGHYRQPFLTFDDSASPFAIATESRLAPIKTFKQQDYSDFPAFFDRSTWQEESGNAPASFGRSTWQEESGNAPASFGRSTWKEESGDAPVNDLPYLITKDGFHETAHTRPLNAYSRGSHPARMVPAGSWDAGHFVGGDKDCHDMSSKSCASHVDCTCHGFYACTLGRCDILSKTVKQSADDDVWYDGPADIRLADVEEPPLDQHVWHSEPIDFGLLEEAEIPTALLPYRPVHVDQFGSYGAV